MKPATNPGCPQLPLTAAQLLFTYAPFINNLFGTTPLPWQTWLPIPGTGMAAYLLVAFDKWRRRA
jgi:hypothetical protein